jgi:hypothetical protein
LAHTKQKCRKNIQI